MLEFNQEHKVADLSEIKPRIEKAKNIGKVMICGVAISAVLLFSGCGPHVTNQQTTEQQNSQITAVVFESGNAMIVDLQSYEKGVAELKGVSHEDVAADQTWRLYTSDGYELVSDVNSVKILEGIDSREKAEAMAESFIGENGKITYFDDESKLGKTIN